MKKGFTLIELLAVIVILAIVSIIAVPTLLNVIQKSKINALKDSAHGVIEAGRLYYAQNEINRAILFTIVDNTITSEQTNKTLKYKGNIKNGIVVVTTSSNVAICIDDGSNYAVKLVDENDVTTGLGTCEAYESENGKFTVNSPTAELIKQYEKRLKDQKDSYESRIDQLEEEIENSGAIYIGEYTSNTTVDVSSLGATSADQFILVPKNGSYSDGSSWNNNVSEHFTIYSTTDSSYVNGTISLENDTLSITLPVLNATLHGYMTWGTRYYGPFYYSHSIPCKVYYVGNIREMN